MEQDKKKRASEPLAAWPGERREGRDVPAALDAEELTRLGPYAPQWRVTPVRGMPRLQRTFRCRSFCEAMWFTLKVGELADAAGQRPTILADWDHVTVALRTPDALGPHRNDFNVAFEIDALYEQRFGARKTSSDS